MDRPKNSQARKKSSTSRKKKQDDSSLELEMVGEMLFGNIADISPTSMSAEDKMINLGSRIAPEQERNWNETVDSTDIPVTAPVPLMPVPLDGLKNRPTPVPEISAVSSTSRGTSFFSRPVPMAYSLGFTALVLCVVVFLFQIFHSETPSEGDVATTDEIATFEKGEEVSPILPNGHPVTFSTQHQVATMASTEEFPHDSAAIVDSAEEAIPQFDPTLAYANNPPQYEPAEVHPAVGRNASYVPAEQETYPVFQSEMASAPTPVYTTSTGVDVWQNQTSISYQAGSTMDEIPVYQQPVAGMSNVAQYPTYAPTTPAVGNQATFSSPRKLSPPPAQIKNSQVNENLPTEDTYPSFDPGRGVEASIPVQYR